MSRSAGRHAAPRSPAGGLLGARSADVERRRFRVGGVVQGVGFRPFVFRLATALRLSGWVRNEGAGVEIEVQGDAVRIESFRRRLRAEAPAPSCVDDIVEAGVGLARDEAFAILPSAAGPLVGSIGHDVATCPQCLQELFDPADRRYRYAFTNCTCCGPRYTITRQLPYDRPGTAMSSFELCPSCAAEYRSPENRRFHAEPNACPACGPRLALMAPDRARVPCADPLAAALAALQDGAIVAIKGLGGFHLACDARHEGAVGRLRERKRREEKPFAIMLANRASAERFARVDDVEARLLEGSERPIVLLDKRPTCDAALPGVAPGVGALGVLLPYTPLHYLLFHEAAGRPSGTGWLGQAQALALVMTSANTRGEPIVAGNEEAFEALSGLADWFLLHDRDIVARCEDSVVRAARGDDAPGAAEPAIRFVRRGRGYAPHAVVLAHGGPPVLALGASYKNAVAVTRGDRVFLSPHIGDLDTVAGCDAQEAAVAHLESLLSVQPVCVVHDLHPDVAATRLALQLAQRRGLPCLAVQHHHAHIAAVLAEHGLAGPAIGVALDGVGYGTDGRAWGGELLRVDGGACERLGHLTELALPGGDRAAREPWRMAASALHALGQAEEIERRFARRPEAPMVARMLARGFNAPLTSSMGRWFDAAAGLLGLRDESAFEGQAPMLLEASAERHGAVAPLDAGYAVDGEGRLSLLPLLEHLLSESDTGHGAALFHATLVAALDAWIAAAVESTGVSTVAFGGGCFLNRILSHGLRRRLSARGCRVLEARLVPPNDGGIALGQAWVALQRND